MQKCQTRGSWASMDQASSTSTHRGHRVLSCATDLLQLHKPCVLYMSTNFTPGNPGQKQDHLSLLLPSPSRLQLPSHPYPGCISPCWARRAGLLCHRLPQSSASRAGTCPEQPRRATLANREFKLIPHMLTFYQGSCNVCCSWTSGAGELHKNCKFSFKKKHFQIWTLQLKKCKLPDDLTGDYCLSKHKE